MVPVIAKSSPLATVDLERVLPAPVGRVEDEAAARLDRPAVVDRAIGRLARVDVELLEQAAEADAGALVADADADRAILVVNAQGDHRALEPRVGHARHRQQQLAGQERRVLGHAATMVRGVAAGKQFGALVAA